MSTSDMTAVVTGAGSRRGIGRATAHALAAAGWNIAVLDLDEAGAKETADSVAAVHGVVALGAACDVTDDASVDTALATVTGALPPVGAVVNNAGITSPVPFLEVTAAGAIKIVAGTGKAGYTGDGAAATTARLSLPAGVAVDAKDDVYIADSANNVVRRVDAATGVITTVAGDYAAGAATNDCLGGYSGDGGPATSAQLNDPQGVAVDGAGHLFIADTFNNAIREVAPDGTVTDGVAILWGTVLNATLTFLITAAVVYFLMVLPMAKYLARQEARRKAKEGTQEVIEVSELEVLKEIRDALVAQRGSGHDRT